LLQRKRNKKINDSKYIKAVTIFLKILDKEQEILYFRKDEDELNLYSKDYQWSRFNSESLFLLFPL
jgi:hypothetical protein